MLTVLTVVLYTALYSGLIAIGLWIGRHAANRIFARGRDAVPQIPAPAVDALGDPYRTPALPRTRPTGATPDEDPRVVIDRLLSVTRGLRISEGDKDVYIDAIVISGKPGAVDIRMAVDYRTVSGKGTNVHTALSALQAAVQELLQREQNALDEKRARVTAALTRKE